MRFFSKAFLVVEYCHAFMVDERVKAAIATSGNWAWSWNLH